MMTVIDSEKKEKNISDNLGDKIKQKIPEKFDLSIIGKINLKEAEEVAREDVIFLNEDDLIEGLEDFELVPIKNKKEFFEEVKDTKEEKKEIFFESDEDFKKDEKSVILNEKVEKNSLSADLNNLNQISDSDEIGIINETESEIKINDFKKEENNKNIFKTEESVIEEEKSNISTVNDNVEVDSEIRVAVDEKNDTEIDHYEIDKVIEELSTKKLFSVTINEEILDDQLASILHSEKYNRTDDNIGEKFKGRTIDQKCKFIDDQFTNQKDIDDIGIYKEDILTERLVKMIEVADGKLEILETVSSNDEFSGYILEDYTLYNSEKFDTVFKEEIFYLDSDFDFIDNAIIRDDFSKYIHEIDDYFESEESLIQSEISEILGLVPEENEYIEDKLFGDYYKRYDLDNEIDFIKPEIDFFRSNYSGLKNPTYFTEDQASIVESEKVSIEEDISTPNAVVFEEDISEIRNILQRNFEIGNATDELIEDEKIEVTVNEEIPDITDKIVILEDKEKIIEIASEFPEKHDDLIKLLSYLDGLFERLPEEVIRKFAESEYFELYSKVLKEMGV